MLFSEPDRKRSLIKIYNHRNEIVAEFNENFEELAQTFIDSISKIKEPGKPQGRGRAKGTRRYMGYYEHDLEPCAYTLYVRVERSYTDVHTSQHVIGPFRENGKFTLIARFAEDEDRWKLWWSLIIKDRMLETGRDPYKPHIKMPPAKKVQVK